MTSSSTPVSYIRHCTRISIQGAKKARRNNPVLRKTRVNCASLTTPPDQEAGNAQNLRFSALHTVSADPHSHQILCNCNIDSFQARPTNPRTTNVHQHPTVGKLQVTLWSRKPNPPVGRLSMQQINMRI